MQRIRTIIVTTVLVLLASCGGGGSSVDPATGPGSATVGGAAQTEVVTITGVNGAQLIVPPGAIEAPVTVRIGTDSSGAPALPAWLRSAGPMYALTPHGSSFAQAVSVRIPKPDTPVPQDQRLALAKASIGGEWEILGLAQEVDGMLVAPVDSFSFVMPVLIGQVAVFQPWSATASVECGGQDCQALVGPADVTLRVTVSGVVLPQGCDASSYLLARVTAYRDSYGFSQISETRRFGSPLLGGTFTQSWSDANVRRMQSGVISVSLVCPSGPTLQIGGGFLTWRKPRLLTEVQPLQIRVPQEVSAGSRGVATALFMGGANGVRGQDWQPYPYQPTVDNTATVDWERSDDGGASWRLVATSYQHMADPSPFGGAARTWLYWRVQHEFATDPNATGTVKFRVRSCVDARDVEFNAQGLLSGKVLTERRCRSSDVASANVIAQAVPPTFTTLPRSQLILAGQSASLTALAAGLPAATLQWQTRPANSDGAWTNVSTGNGATSANYTTPLLTLADNGVQYRVLATNAGGTAEGPPVTISVSAQPVAPTITADLSNVRTVRGGDATFGVGVRGTEPLNFEWRVNGNVVIGENAPVITLKGVLGVNNVTVTVSNAAGSVSSRTGSVEVFEGPIPDAPVSIVLQPVATTVTAGNTATLAVKAEGSEPMAYQWRRNGQPVAGAPNAPIFTLPGAAAGDAGTYTVVVSNSRGAVTSADAVLTVSAAGGSSPVAPSITVQPVGLSVNPGQTATLAVGASGSGTLGYQWAREGVPINGATTPVLTLSAVLAGDAGSYTVTVTNPQGSVTSSAAGVVVVPAPGAPIYTAQQFIVDAIIGDSPRILMRAEGTPAPQCLWLRNGVLLPGATDCTGLTLNNLTLADSGAVFTSVAYSSGGAAIGGPAVLNVQVGVAPTITLQPVSTSTTPGGLAQFSATASGTPMPSRQWLVDGVALPLNTGGYSQGACTFGYDAFGANLTLVNVSQGCDGRTLALRATNSQGSATSDAVVLTVQVAVAPSITTQPQNQSITEGGFARFDAVVNGMPAPSREWSINGTAIPVAFQVVFTQGNCTFGYDVTQAVLTLYNVPLSCNGSTFVLTSRNAYGSVVSNTVTLTVTPAVPANALTATQIVAGQEWSMVLRPDRSVWAWGQYIRNDGSVQYANLLAANQAQRPVRMYPAVLTDVRAISGWFNGFWALKGEPGTTGSRVLHWGGASAGSDGRGGDGNGSLGSSIPPRYNEAAPVEVLERVNNVPQPVDRVCAIAGGGEQLAMIRAINSAGTTTDCNAGSAKTVWFVGSLLGQGYGSTGVAFAMPGLPVDVPPALIFTGQTTSGSPPLVIALEDGRIYGLGLNPYGGLGVSSTTNYNAGNLSGPLLLPATWGNARGFGMSFYYSLFTITSNGSVTTSGYDSNGELGLGSVIGGSTLGPLPVKAETCAALPCADPLTGVTAITGTTAGVTLALKNGAILGWGAGNSSGLRGPGATTNQPFPRSVPSTVSGFTALSASNTHALVIGQGNVVYAWGSNLRFALGDTQDRAAPTMVTVP